MTQQTNQTESPKYATLLYDVRQQLGISWNEYIYLDMVQKLQLSKGWCFKSLENCATDLGFTKRGTIKMRDRLIGLELLARNDKGNVRVTDKYIEVAVNSVHRNEVQNGVFVKRSVNSVPKSVNSVHRIGELSSKITGGENNNRKTENMVTLKNDLAAGDSETAKSGYQHARAIVEKIKQKSMATIEAPQSTQKRKMGKDPIITKRAKVGHPTAFTEAANMLSYSDKAPVTQFLMRGNLVVDG